jgi:hypothetical protein
MAVWHFEDWKLYNTCTEIHSVPKGNTLRLHCRNQPVNADLAKQSLFTSSWRQAALWCL